MPRKIVKLTVSNYRFIKIKMILHKKRFVLIRYLTGNIIF